MKSIVLVSVALVALLPMTAAARGRVGVFVGPAFTPFGWYGPYYGPYFGGYPYGVYGRSPNAGRVKLETPAKDAEVFINGSYAGTVKQLKTMTMRSGSYDIELRTPGGASFQERVYVVAGKTVNLHPDFRAPQCS